MTTTGGWTVEGNNTFNGATTSFAGNVLATEPGFATKSAVPPIYTASGGAISTSAHMVFGTTSCTTQSLSASAFNWGCGATVTLTAPATFTGQATYACAASFYSLNPSLPEIVDTENVTGASFQIDVGLDGAISEVVTLLYVCIGY